MFCPNNKCKTLKNKIKIIPHYIMFIESFIYIKNYCTYIFSIQIIIHVLDSGVSKCYTKSFSIV